MFRRVLGRYDKIFSKLEERNIFSTIRANSNIILLVVLSKIDAHCRFKSFVAFSTLWSSNYMETAALRLAGGIRNFVVKTFVKRSTNYRFAIISCPTTHTNFAIEAWTVVVSLSFDRMKNLIVGCVKILKTIFKRCYSVAFHCIIFRCLFRF